MMLVSISEETPTYNVDYKSRLSSNSNSRRGSGSSLSGWGTAATRKSFKTDLASLAAAEPMDINMSLDSSANSQRQAPSMPYQVQQQSNTMEDEETWGYFDADAFCQQQ